MVSLVLEAAGVKGKIITTAKKIKKIKNDKFTYHYLPNGITSKGVADIEVIEEKMDSNFKISYPSIRINSFEDHRGLVVACDYLMERARQNKLGIYSISSSSAHKNGTSVVFFGGATNLGKSSSAIKMVSKGFEIYSDEKTLLDLENVVLYGGSKSIPLRKKILQEKLNNHLDEFLEIERESICPKIGLMVIPHIDHGLNKAISYKMDPLDFFYHLNGEISKKIRGGTKFVDNFRVPLTSIDTDLLSQKRVNLVKSLTDVVSGYYIQGSLNQIAEIVQEKIG